MTDTYKPQTNGVVSSIDTISGAIESRGHKVEIFAPTGGDKTNTFLSVPSKIGKDYRIAILRSRSLRNKFKEKGIDLVHIHTPFTLGVAALSASRKEKLPAVGTFHTLLSEYTHYVSESLPDRFMNLFVRGIWKYVIEFYSRFEILTVPSAPIKEMLSEKGLENIHVLPNAVDIEHYRPAGEPKNGSPKLLFVGRIGKEKRLEVLVGAAPRIIKEYPDAEFVVVGEGEHRGYYEDLAEDSGVGDWFDFRGHIPEGELIREYQSCDVFVIPSDTETQGLVALEAMACGSPVVGANARGLRYTISHGSDGFLFPPGSSSELSRYVLELLGDDDLRLEMAVNARRKAEKFSADRIGDKWIDFYSRVLA